MQYVVTNELTSSDGVVELNVDGTCQINGSSFRLTRGNRPGLYYLTADGEKPIPILLSSDGIGSVRINVRGYTYDCKVLKNLHHQLYVMLNASPAALHRTIKVTAPMPGLLKSVFFSDNTRVRKGETLFTLEAMKMENAIASPVAGILHSVRMTEGVPVEKGSVLCIVEPA